MSLVERSIYDGGMSASPIEERIAARAIVLTAQRTRVVGMAMLVALCVCLPYPMFIRPDAVAATAMLVPAASAAIVVFVTRNRAASFALDILQLVVVASAAIFGYRYTEPAYASIAALMMIAYAAVQLDVVHFLVVIAIDGVVVATVFWFSGLLAGVQMLTIVAAWALGGLMNVANRRFTESTEVLRARAEASASKLREALADAEHQIREREQAELERDAAEVAKEQLTHRLFEAQRLEALGTLAGGFAHEMNNLLGGVLALATLVREETTGDAQQDADEIIAAAKRGSALTRDLLSLGRRRSTSSKAPTNLEPMLARVAQLLTRTLPKRIETRLDLQGELVVQGDSEQLEQALMNLCLNAVDAIGESGAVTIASRLERVEEPRATALGIAAGSWVVLSVTDTGTGMPPEMVRRMFEPFFTTKGPGRGTGLGLSMVYAAVQDHCGAVHVDSDVGRGTRIELYLPMAEGPVEAASVSDATGPIVRGRVLVIDDDPLLRTTARRTLERAGFDVMVAGGGAQGIELYAQSRAGVILLDVAMPEMDGPETFRRLIAFDPDVRVVLTSGYAFQKNIEACIQEGARGFLEKPYSPKILIQTLVDAQAPAAREAVG
jgi:signal transduction histidine kinase/ActR/RegA family two-component response regulator